MVEFVASTWEVDVETQAGEQTSPLRVSFPCAITMALGVQLKEGEQLRCCTRTGCVIGNWSAWCGGGRGWARDRARVRYGVLPITGIRSWGDHLEAHMDHAWLLMRSHAQAETLLHSGELGAVQVEGDDDKNDARSDISGGSKGSKGKAERRWGGPAGPRGPAPLSLVSPPSPLLPKWRIGCINRQQAQQQWQ